LATLMSKSDNKDYRNQTKADNLKPVPFQNS
jgi:hypothetical protein